MQYFVAVLLWLDSQIFRYFLQKKSDMIALTQEV
jgi:hypothetical protein